MPTITMMNREAAKHLNRAVREALEAVAAEHGLTVSVGGGSFSPAEGTFKPRVQFAVPEQQAASMSQDASLLGLPDDVIGRSFTYQGREYTVSGINLRARKMPVQATRHDGRGFKFAVATVKHALAQ